MISRVFKLWIISCCAFIVLWVLDIVPGALLVCTLSLPVLFAVACAFLLPSPRVSGRRYVFDEDSNRTLRAMIDEFSFPSHDRKADDGEYQRDTNSYEFSHAELTTHTFDSDFHKTTVFDRNSDGSFNFSGTGSMSSGLSDF